MAVRFYIDADLLGVAKLLVQVRADVTYPGDTGGLGPDHQHRPACPIRPGAKDTEWIPTVAASGWVVVTRDRRIKSKPSERDAVREHSARIVALDARRQLNKWEQLEIIVCQWRKLETLTELPGPWIYRASRADCRPEVF